MDLLDLFIGRTDYSQDAIPERDPAFSLDSYRVGACEPDAPPLLTTDEWACWRVMLDRRPSLRCLSVIAPITPDDPTRVG